MDLETGFPEARSKYWRNNLLNLCRVAPAVPKGTEDDPVAGVETSRMGCLPARDRKEVRKNGRKKDGLERGAG